MLRVAILTISTSAARGKRQDLSGAEVRKYAEEQAWKITKSQVIPDDVAAIHDFLTETADRGEVDVIFTTGGTGLSPTDKTPEVTRSVIQQEIPGIAEAMRLKTYDIVHTSILSRAVAGVRSKTLIINLPGSPAGVRECLEVIGDVVQHACEVMRGEVRDCGGR